MLAKNSKHSWTKYNKQDRPRLTIRKDNEGWTCQCCGANQPNCTDPFLLHLEDYDYLRLCDQCIFVKINIPSITLTTLILKRRQFDSNAEYRHTQASLEDSPLAYL